MLKVRAGRFVALVAALLCASGVALPAPGARAATLAASGSPIRLVVSVPAGSSADVAARLLADGMEKTLGRPVVVENRPGADGIIAFRHVADAPADGSVLLYGLSSQFVVNPVTHANLAYDPLRDVAPVTQVAFQRFALAVNASLPVATPAQLAAHSRLHAGTVSYGSGTSTFMLMAEAFKQSTGADMLQVPFKGGSAAIQALAGGTVQAAFVPPADALPLLSSGLIRLLAVSGTSRLPLLPGVPTFAEFGLKETMPVWSAVFAPPGTPPDVIERTRRAVVSALALPDVRERMEALAQDCATGSPDQLRAMIARDAERVKDIALRAGVIPY
jgi:tripartite-type tricarboxylate transporter receptor subunit TctC